MPAITLSKSGVRYDHQEWMSLVSSGEAEVLLAKYGPGFTDEAWAKHHAIPNRDKGPRRKTFR
jgi:hypothetical protein